MVKTRYVNMLSSKRNGTLYIGVTSDPVKRVCQHKNDLADGFTRRYGVHNLVWHEKSPFLLSLRAKRSKLVAKIFKALRDCFVAKNASRNDNLGLFQQAAGWKDLFEELL